MPTIKRLAAAIGPSNTPTRIGTATATEYNLEACSGCGLSNWGWEDNGWGSMGPHVYFAATAGSLELWRSDGTAAGTVPRGDAVASAARTRAQIEGEDP